MKKELILKPISGYIILALVLLILAGAIFSFINEIVWLGLVLTVLFIFSSKGFTVVNPNESCVMVLFGAYKGTVKDNGLFWLNPFYVKNKISLRARNFDSDPIKVNDKIGNPIKIGCVLVWKVDNTFKAAFDVDQYEHFVFVQSDAALRKLAGSRTLMIILRTMRLQ